MGGRGSSSGIKRGSGKARMSASTKKKDTPTPQVTGKSFERVDENFNVSQPDSIEKLKEMAARGEMPIRFEGSYEDKEKVYEQFTSIFGEPPGVLNEYELSYPIEGNTHTVQVNLTTDKAVLGGIAIETVNYLRRGKMSEASKHGQIVHAILNARREAEGAASSRMGGYPTLDLARKWGDRVLSRAEKVQADREIHNYVSRIFNSPITSGGEISMNTWREVNGGSARRGSYIYTQLNGGR